MVTPAFLKGLVTLRALWRGKEGFATASLLQSEGVGFEITRN
jgi:hypothetical protein